ncbi:hypothetical protein F4775DRAFT_488179 [Biscogniauxia sp. FL1348]|nr:hypothetical protein F4775DRAFT_488179 [Biscogniauxia sp. FL1348]
MATKLTRIAIVNDDKCKPKKCRQECKKSCPVEFTPYTPFYVDDSLAFVLTTSNTHRWCAVESSASK